MCFNLLLNSSLNVQQYKLEHFLRGYYATDIYYNCIAVEFLDAADTEWSLMWQHLAQDPINNGDAACIYQNIAWQYMGSTQDHHYFKHQLHPFTLKSEYRYIERHCPGVQWRQIMQ